MEVEEPAAVGQTAAVSAFESVEHLEQVLEDVRNLDREQLYALVDGGRGSWPELKASVERTAMTLTDLCVSLNTDTEPDEDDRWPTTDPEERRRRDWLRASRERQEAYHRLIFGEVERQED
jgi:hypothetical protein